MFDILFKLKDYVPLFQTVLWICFVIGLLIVFQKTLKTIVLEIISRIKKGSSIKLGQFEIGDKLKELNYEKQSSDIVCDSNIDREEQRVKIYKKNKGIFITHIIFPSKENTDSFNIYIYLIRHKLGDFSDIESTEFFFGHMWDNKIFKEYEKNGTIGISTSAYAPFLCTCKIKFHGGEEIILERYIDFEMKTVYENLN